MVADVDSDGDGHSNLEEFIAKTNPQSPGSVFSVRAIEEATPDQPWAWVLTWDTAPDRRYSVFTHTDLATTWPDAVYHVNGDGTPKSYTNTFQDMQSRFFRIGVELLP